MPPSSIAAASGLLRGCWARGETIAALPHALRPASRAQGYAIQACLGREETLFGWKIAATSAAGQAHVQVDGPLAGRLLADRVIADGGTCPFGTNRMRVAEVEFAFRMGMSLLPRAQPYAPDDVMAAVATLHPAIEVPDSRFDPFERAGAAQLIADNACAHYFVLGAATPEGWRDLDLAVQPTSGRINDGPAQAGSGGNVLSDPRIALAWLVNELSGLGEPLLAGQVVTTGTSLPPMPIAPGDRIVGSLGALGSVSVTMAPD